jgi:hypothetical protein
MITAVIAEQRNRPVRTTGARQWAPSRTGSVEGRGDGFEIGDELVALARLQAGVRRRGKVVGDRLDPLLGRAAGVSEQAGAVDEAAGRPMTVDQCVAEGLAALRANRPTHVAGRSNRILLATVPRSVMVRAFGPVLRRVASNSG